MSKNYVKAYKDPYGAQDRNSAVRVLKTICDGVTSSKGFFTVANPVTVHSIQKLHTECFVVSTYVNVYFQK